MQRYNTGDGLWTFSEGYSMCVVDRLPSFTEDDGLASVKLVASDMDFTLLADDGTMPPDMPELIDALAVEGVAFCAASGRPTYTLRDMFPTHCDDMAFIADNGAAVSYRNRTVFKSLISPTDYHELIDVTLAETDGAPVLCGMDRAYVLARDRAHDAKIRTYYHAITYLETFEGVDVEANKYTILFPENNSMPYYKRLMGPRFGERFSVTCAGVEWIDVMNKGVDKGTGIERLCAHLGIAPAEVAAFGDTDNDAQMLATAGHSFLMANGQERIRPYARYEAPSNNERGVVTVIRAILAAKNR